MSSLFRRVSNLVWGSRRSTREKDKKSPRGGRKKKGKKDQTVNEVDTSMKQTINSSDTDQAVSVSRDRHAQSGKMAAAVADDNLDGGITNVETHVNRADLIDSTECDQLNNNPPADGVILPNTHKSGTGKREADDTKFAQSDAKERELTESGESQNSDLSHLEHLSDKEASILLNEMYGDSPSHSDKEVEPAKENKTPKKGFKHILRRKISATLTNIDLEQCDPEICVSLLKIPSVNTFGALKKKVKSSGKVWIQGFLDANGLDALLDCVDTLGSKRVTQLSDALLLLECVACIKVVMNSKMGLECLVQHPDYVRRLVKASLYEAPLIRDWA